MRRLLTGVVARRQAAGEQGVTAVMVAMITVGLLVASALVVDFGLVRIDRQVNKSVADSATLAGLAGLAGPELGDKRPHPYRGVCAALRYLRSNDARFAAVTSSPPGSWTDGNGNPVGNGCNESALQAKVCTSADLTTWAKFTWTGTWQGEPLKVVIQSGYVLPGPAATSGPSPDTGWREDSLPAAQADSNDTAQGCEQLATMITETRKPGLGSLATASDLSTSVRSVGRVALGPGGPAPAMLLLDRSGCMVLSASGSGSYVHVYGDESDGERRPGTIHSDSNGSTCSSSSHANVFYGGSANSIVAYAAPSATSSTQPDPTLPGQITSVAANGASFSGSVVDDAANVYGSAALDASGAGTAAKTAPVGSPLVTRAVVDDRYLGLDDPNRGVKGAIASANSVFATVTSDAAATARGYLVFDSCNLNSSDMSAVTSSSKVYINCTSNNGYVGTTAIPAGTVVFAGAVNPMNTASLSVSLPNAHHVYIFGSADKDAISVGNGGAFSMHTSGSNLSGSQCSSALDPTSKAVLFVKAGDIKQTGGLLQLCKTTVFMLGNRSDGCLPSISGTAPTPVPCGGTTGDGQITLTGGSVDWTAPNTIAGTTDGAGWPTAAAKAAWTDPDGPEDLALWDESAGTASSPKMAMAGNGALHTVGVFMVPNAAPFIIGGGGTQSLSNAQYIASDISLNGNAYISMKVDANSAVTVQALKPVGLVR